MFYGKSGNNKLVPHRHSYTTRAGVPVYVTTQNGGMYITVDMNGNIQAVNPQDVVRVNQTPQYNTGTPMVQTPNITGMMGQPNTGIPVVNTSVTGNSGTPVLNNSIVTPPTTNEVVVQPPSVQPTVVNAPTSTKPLSNEPKIGSFPHIPPLVIKRRKETVEIEDGEYVWGYFKDYERDKLMEERLFFKDKLIIQRDQYEYLYELFDAEEVREKDGAVIIDILLWDEGYNKDNENAVYSILDLSNWGTIASEIRGLKDKLLQKYLNRKITNYLNNKLRFLGIKYYPKSGGYFRVMMKSFMDKDTGYDKLISQLENTIFNPSHKSYDKEMKHRIETTLTESLVALKTAVNEMPEFEVSYLPELQEVLDKKSVVTSIVPVFVKVICLYTESIVEELEKLEVGDSRNVTPSETIMRMLHHIDSKDTRDISTYDYRIITEDGEFDIQRYKKEVVITRIG